MSVALLAAISAACLLTVAPIARADWPSTGLPLATGTGAQVPVAVVPDDAGGGFVIWTDAVSASSKLQRITATGDLASGWPVGGVSLGTNEFLAATRDGQGGVIVFSMTPPFDGMYYGRYYQAFRFDGSGQRAAGWPVNGVRVRTESRFFPSDDFGLENRHYLYTFPDGAGGAYLAFMSEQAGGKHSYCRYLHALGGGTSGTEWATPTGDWSYPYLVVAPNGIGGLTALITLSNLPFGSSNLLDFSSTGTVVHSRALQQAAQPRRAYGFNKLGPGSDLLVASTLTGTPGAALMRLTETLDVAPGWGPDSVTSDYVPLATDAMGGCFASVLVGGVTRVQRLDLASAPPQGLWPPAALPSWLGGPIVADEQGGGFQAWSYANNLRVSHAMPDGSPSPTFTLDGIVLSSTCPGYPQLAGAGPGAAMVAWADTRNGNNDVYLQYLTETGAPTPTTASVAFTDVTPERAVIEWLVADVPAELTVERRLDANEWIAAGPAAVAATDRRRFEDRDVQAGDAITYRLASPGGPIAGSEASVVVPSTARFALRGFATNPLTGPPSVEFTLPDGAPARLELLDVSGRRIAVRDVGVLGAGRHVVAFENLATPPGVVYARLARGGVTLSARAVLLR